MKSLSIVKRVVSVTLLSTMALASTEIHAYGGAFGTGPTVQQLSCDMPNLKGSFATQSAGYEASGTCVQWSADDTNANPDAPKGTSEFPDANHSTELFRAAWTAQGGYNPLTKATSETITFPAPTLNEPTPPGRPYGRFVSKMTCATDPWLDPSAQCTAITSTATGNLGAMGAALKKEPRPFTSHEKPAQQQTLYDAHQRTVQIQTAALTTGTTDRQASYVTKAPQILRPYANSTEHPQTPITIRVAAPVGDGKVQTYELHIEMRNAAGAWQAMTTLPVAAAELEGVLGYQGWGGHAVGTSANTIATAGTWRIQVKATAPHASDPSPWREFTVAGAPGPSAGVIRSSNALGSIRNSAPTIKVESKVTPAAAKPINGLDWSRAAPSSIGSH